MFKNYFKTALRNLTRNKVYSFINIAGLSLGLACSMLIILYVKDEVSYDRFHEGVNQIYRITSQSFDKKENKINRIAIPVICRGPVLRQIFPGFNLSFGYRASDGISRKAPISLRMKCWMWIRISFRCLVSRSLKETRKPASTIRIP